MHAKALSYFCRILWAGTLRFRKRVGVEVRRFVVFSRDRVKKIRVFSSPNLILASALHEKWLLQLIDSSLRSLRISVISALNISRPYCYAEITELRRDRRRGLQIPTGTTFRAKKQNRLGLWACHHACVSPILQPSRTKVLIRLGKSLFLGSGKATTRVKRSITAAFEGTDFRIASPRGHPEETVLLP
jgi:hypothetical protein